MQKFELLMRQSVAKCSGTSQMEWLNSNLHVSTLTNLQEVLDVLLLLVLVLFNEVMILLVPMLNFLYGHQSIYSKTDSQVCSINTCEFSATLLFLTFMFVEVQLRM